MSAGQFGEALGYALGLAVFGAAAVVALAHLFDSITRKDDR